MLHCAVACAGCPDSHPGRGRQSSADTHRRGSSLAARPLHERPTVTLHLPQVERWTSNWFGARAVEVKPAGQGGPARRGLVRGAGQRGSLQRLVALDRLEITRGVFRRRRTTAATRSPSCASLPVRRAHRVAGLSDHGARIRPGGGAAGAARAQPHAAGHHLGHKPRRARSSLTANRSCARPRRALERVINTPALLCTTRRARILSGGRAPLVRGSASLAGPWSLVQTPPAAVAALAAAPTNRPPRPPTSPRRASSSAPGPRNC